MDWANRFSENTTKLTFNGASGAEDTDFLTKKLSSYSDKYYIDNNVKSFTADLRDYDGTTLQFVAIMPETDLSSYIKNVKMEDINTIINNSKSEVSNEYQGVTVRIPKFKYEYSRK